ncbi:hypothetical protein ACFL59_14390 [Planctomycetota bacterium]
MSWKKYARGPGESPCREVKPLGKRVGTSKARAASVGMALKRIARDREKQRHSREEHRPRHLELLLARPLRA